MDLNGIASPTQSGSDHVSIRPTIAEPFERRAMTVPTLFRGRARSLRDRLMADDIEASRIIDEVTAKAVARYKRHPIPRPSTLADLARAWRQQMPPFGRLNLEVALGKRELVIRELRAGACVFRVLPRPAYRCSASS
jgi:hypothetical protein